MLNDRSIAIVEPLKLGSRDDRGSKSRKPNVAEPWMRAKGSKATVVPSIVETESRSGDASNLSSERVALNEIDVNDVTWCRSNRPLLVVTRFSSSCRLTSRKRAARSKSIFRLSPRTQKNVFDI